MSTYSSSHLLEEIQCRRENLSSSIFIKKKKGQKEKRTFLYLEKIHTIWEIYIDLFKLHRVKTKTKQKQTVRYGSETISYRIPLLWANLPEKYIFANSLSKFKSKIKTWKCDTCVCRLCRTFLQNLGYWLTASNDQGLTKLSFWLYTKNPKTLWFYSASPPPTVPTSLHQVEALTSDFYFVPENLCVHVRLIKIKQ